MDSLTKRERLRRVALLCCHFSRNLAYYRAWHEIVAPGEYGEFLATIDGNFIDMAVIEWCKLFGDKNGKHHWRKVVKNSEFEADMLEYLNETAGQFRSYIDEMRQYRDKFLAHLDDDHIMNIPRMELAKGSVKFLYDYLFDAEASADDLTGLPKDLAAYYKACFDKVQSFCYRFDLKTLA